MGIPSETGDNYLSGMAGGLKPDMNMEIAGNQYPVGMLPYKCGEIWCIFRPQANSENNFLLVLRNRPTWMDHNSHMAA